MAHEIKLEVAEKKAFQLNTLLYVLRDMDFNDLDGQQISALVELASSLSDPVSSWLIEENAHRKES
ncbi:hypothetical protein KWH75_16355 [Morganella morganii]|uniref:hypothetical protein n=1 Tax=Morganella morganii TaxID=582 RepID=UPI0021CE730F|nr:hypothetical protein [Morganella morganii]MCU6238636.1 hypothetical protein [Morganella morganii]